VQNPFGTPAILTYSLSLSSSKVFRSNSNAPRKLDFPEPFGPITTLIGFSGSLSIERMLLKPWIVMYSSALVGMSQGIATIITTLFDNLSQFTTT
jgi:hypothetical protein